MHPMSIVNPIEPSLQIPISSILNKSSNKDCKLSSTILLEKAEEELPIQECKILNRICLKIRHFSPTQVIKKSTQDSNIHKQDSLFLKPLKTFLQITKTAIQPNKFQPNNQHPISHPTKPSTNPQAHQNKAVPQFNKPKIIHSHHISNTKKFNHLFKFRQEDINNINKDSNFKNSQYINLNNIKEIREFISKNTNQQ